MNRSRSFGLELTAAFLTTLALGACGTGEADVTLSPTTVTAPSSSSTTTQAVPTEPAPTTAAPVPATAEPARSADGRSAPMVPDGAAAIAADIDATEAALRDPATDPAAIADLGHRQQVLYRHLGRHPEWDAEVLATVDPTFAPIVELQLAARRSFYGLHTGYSDSLPAWRIVEPEPAEDLLAFYREGEATYGIEWEYLAAINLVETGMGRIYGFSTAGAQGPMQFIPATWADYGTGDINNPRDAILAAARYLDARGGPEDMDRALFGYNNSDLYVEGVSRYAELLRLDPASFIGLYHWEIHFSSSVGDLWLPVGYDYEERILIEDYLAEHPESAPPANGWVPEADLD